MLEEKKIDEILDITSLTSEGQGVGRQDNMVVFVEGAIPGDRVKARMVHKAKSYANAKMLEILAPSRNRISAPCKVADRCGGCSLQHMDYQAQCGWKQSTVIEAMTRIGGFGRADVEAALSPILAMKHPYHYRNNVQMPVSGTSDSPTIGFYESDSHTVVDIKECLVQHPVGDVIRETVRDFIIKNNISIYNEVNGTGLLRHLVIRTGFRTKQVMVVFVMNGRELPFQDEIVQNLIVAVQQNDMNLTSVFLNINDKKTSLVFGKEFLPVFGKEAIEEILCGIRYRISPSAFFQVNSEQAELLYETVVAFADMNPKDTVFDLYCGTGSISLVLAKHCKKVIGVEVVAQAIADAKENARANEISNAEFFVGRAEEVFPDYVSRGVHADVIVVDPPRKGLDTALLESIARMSPPKIVYVSCNPATLARDCKVLCENGGYTLVKMQPVDLFPWTGHVETIIMMTNCGQDKK